MPKKLILFVITTLLFFLDSTILPSISWFAISLTFAFGLAWSAVGTEWDALFLALVTGFFADINTNHLFGINMLLNMFTFLGLYYGKKYLRHEKNWIMIVFMGLATFLRYGLHYLLNMVTGLSQSFQKVPERALMVMALAVFLLPLVRRLQNRLGKRVLK